MRAVLTTLSILTLAGLATAGCTHDQKTLGGAAVGAGGGALIGSAVGGTGGAVIGGVGGGVAGAVVGSRL
ncbi:hypothetical protein [Mangrovibrevibacter kandeliae]|uniref:hypothetical protein n=1 Tax=Mangrovibrevibacter kandeliae TaxID=2968473 RepID=UPI00211773A9|nr:MULTISPECIES: hypothetical protein [unclassified Aurantimonas]MCQ8781272.1 hypothetical protein [Aurantimonas sp. CSK15Z-1]MCW4114054.1 hypothetical protein [Aurantimonas sp. MSK8Z-1]